MTEMFGICILMVILGMFMGLPYAESFLHPDDRDATLQPQQPAATEEIDEMSASAEIIPLKKAA